MKVETHSSAIAATAMLQELLLTLRNKGILDQATINATAIDACRKLNETKDPVFHEAAKTVLALYKR